MQKRDNYISGHLVDIRDRLKSQVQENSADNQDNYGNSVVPAAMPEKKSDGIDLSAVKRRSSDAVKSRTELQELLAAAIASAGQRIKLAEEEKRELEEAERKLTGIASAPADASPAGVGNYFRQVEEVRLDYIRSRAKYHQEDVRNIAGGKTENVFPAYFAGQVRAGAALSMILAIAVIVAAFIIGGFFFAAINGGV